MSSDRPSRSPLDAITCLCAVALAAACGDVKIVPLRMPPPPIECLDDMVGYATLAGTTRVTSGGEGGEHVIATTAQQLTSYASVEAPLVIQIQGVLTLTASIRFVSNKTIYGDPATRSGVTGAGLDFTDASNIIIRNLQISKATADEGDAITLLRSQHVWIDHCDLSSEATGGNYDGLVDITHASDFITVSWTSFHDHRDTSLVGHSENNMAEDTGHLTVTYHHNLFERVFSGPRIRFGTGHVYSNLFRDIAAAGSFGVASESYAAVVVEQNLFTNVAQPITTMFSDANGGAAWAEENSYVGQFSNNISVPTVPRPVFLYEYAANTPADTRTLVQACAGIGKLDDPLTYDRQ
jgi:pectate lyase